jgi:probable HAF family extracellular repeat protein
MHHYPEDLTPPRLRRVFAAVVVMIMAGAAASTAGAQSLSLVDLGEGVSAYAINAIGEITGCAPAGSGATHAFVYSAGCFGPCADCADNPLISSFPPPDCSISRLKCFRRRGNEDLR